MNLFDKYLNSVYMEYADGSAYLLYIMEENQEKLVAGSTSHSVSTSAETKSRSTKDVSGKWDEKTVTKLSQTVKLDALVAVDPAAYGYDELLALMKAGKPVKLRYGKKKESLAEGDKSEVGMYVITSLEKNDPANDDSTMSATFENSGAISTESYSATGGSGAGA